MLLPDKGKSHAIAGTTARSKNACNLKYRLFNVIETKVVDFGTS